MIHMQNLKFSFYWMWVPLEPLWSVKHWQSEPSVHVSYIHRLNDGICSNPQRVLFLQSRCPYYSALSLGVPDRASVCLSPLKLPSQTISSPLDVGTCLLLSCSSFSAVDKSLVIADCPLETSNQDDKAPPLIGMTKAPTFKQDGQAARVLKARRQPQPHSARSYHLSSNKVDYNPRLTYNMYGGCSIMLKHVIAIASTLKAWVP